MCLSGKTDVDIDSVEAWKVFSEVHGILYSCFSARFLEPYKRNTIISHKPKSDSLGFYAFTNKESCYSFLKEDYIWATTKYYKVILPVTLYNVIYTGYFQSYHYGVLPAYISQKIFIPSTEEVKDGTV